MKYYKLDENKKVVPCHDGLEWGKWFYRIENIRVDSEMIDGHLISTVFLGISHDFSGSSDAGDIFETMIFNNDGLALDYQTRCHTYQQALDMHKKAVDHILHERKRDRDSDPSLA